VVSDCGALIVDLAEVDFIAIEGLHALFALNIECACTGTTWALIASHAVNRLLRVGDHDTLLPAVGSATEALLLVRRSSRSRGPLLDRVDLRVEMHTARAGAFAVEEGESTAAVRERVAAARAVAEQRWRPHGIRTNAEVSGALLRRKFRPEAAAGAAANSPRPWPAQHPRRRPHVAGRVDASPRGHRLGPECARPQSRAVCRG
jgi:Magnesium chelatase, subunit ChlI C-terminal